MLMGDDVRQLLSTFDEDRGELPESSDGALKIMPEDEGDDEPENEAEDDGAEEGEPENEAEDHVSGNPSAMGKQTNCYKNNGQEAVTDGKTIWEEGRNNGTDSNNR